MDYEGLQVAGALLIVCIVFLYLWIRAERKYKRSVKRYADEVVAN